MGHYPRINSKRYSAERIFHLVDNLLYLLLDLSDSLVGLPLPLQLPITGKNPRSFLHASLQFIGLAARQGRSSFLSCRL